MAKKFKYYWNDVEVTEDEYKKLMFCRCDAKTQRLCAWCLKRKVESEKKVVGMSKSANQVKL